MKIIILSLLLSLPAFANTTDFQMRLSRLKDITYFMEKRPELFTGSSKTSVKKYVKQFKPSEPFVVSFKQKNVVGKTQYGNEIFDADVYIVNPKKSSGMLFWSEPEFVILTEPEWTLFKTEGKPLKQSDVKRIKQLLDW